jgi:hypothetical protein
MMHSQWATHPRELLSQPKPEDLHCKQTPKRRKVHTYSGPEPSVADIEAEFWRIVETPDDVYESLYGQVPAPRLLNHLLHIRVLFDGLQLVPTTASKQSCKQYWHRGRREPQYSMY